MQLKIDLPIKLLYQVTYIGINEVRLNEFNINVV